MFGFFRFLSSNKRTNFPRKCCSSLLPLSIYHSPINFSDLKNRPSLGYNWYDEIWWNPVHSQIGHFGNHSHANDARMFTQYAHTTRASQGTSRKECAFDCSYRNKTNFSHKIVNIKLSRIIEYDSSGFFFFLYFQIGFNLSLVDSISLTIYVWDFLLNFFISLSNFPVFNQFSIDYTI